MTLDAHMNKVANYKLRRLYFAKTAICSPPNDASV
jgi:hypothetical protein